MSSLPDDSGFAGRCRREPSPMRKPSGVIFILVGLGVAAYALGWPEAPALDRQAVREAHAAIKIAQTQPQPNFAVSALAVVPQPASAEMQPLAVRAGRATVSPAKEMPSHVRNKAATRGGTVLVKGAVRTPVGQSTAMRGPPLDRVALTRELQRQLQRVGCYGGSISGTWSPSTRRAMKEFTERVNAALPIDKPDAILLAMVQNHEEMTCGAGCPTGQSPASNGRCLPSAIVVRDSAKHAPGTKMRSAKLPSSPAKSRSIGARSVAADGAADAGRPIAGRMALAGPRLETGGAPPPSGPRTARQHDYRKHAPRLRKPAARSPKYITGNRKRMDAWEFSRRAYW